jgi:hypothetical protein
MSSTNQIIESMCALKRQQQTVIPQFRLELQSSPYPTYTQYQLDMRRKVEILKYKSNQQNSKANTLTKSQNFSKAMTSTKTLSQATLDKINANMCDSLINVPTPSSSCDVPGPIITLFYDGNVPLYNYATKTEAFAINQSAAFSSTNTN